MRLIPKRPWLRILIGVVAVLAVVLFSNWREATNNGGQKYAEPFRIAGNLYYVGANDVTSFLITGPEGHVLIDGGYPGTAPMIMASIAQLGFKITDVKVLLNSHAHFDHAGGLAELQKASGAELWVSEGDADAVAAGGAGDPAAGIFRFITYFVRYPAPRVDHRFKDGAKVRVGPIELTANVTAGHTRGCTSWSFPVRDGDRELLVVHICSLTLMGNQSLVEPETYPGIRADWEHSFEKLRSLPADIWLASHAREFGRWRKFQQRATAKNPADPFIDRAGYLSAIDKAEERFRNELAAQQRDPSLMGRIRRGL
ncbi:MAG TPA: subclass B3 metallo-beta-lactamase [Gemmatimonadaceae bacterium]|nr:subclass B3 metallo-beta-lactamase [Gemmatimonadaceae bacterium]